jgi:Ankyrin repeats (many copies)
VCSEWKELYKRLAAANVFAFTASGERLRQKCESRMTLSSAVFQSSRRVRMAHQHGLRFGACPPMHHVAGKVADRHVLATAHELGMPYSRAILLGASEKGSVITLRWLHFDQSCALPHNITAFAARGGSVRVMQWLSERGCTLNTKTLFNAAKYRRLRVLEYLHSAGCPMDDGGRACKIAAWNGSLQVLQWLRAHGCPWVTSDVAEAAAHSGNVQMMAWLQQQPGVVLTAAAMTAAARANRQEMCEYLYSQNCPWHEGVCSTAAYGGHLQLLLWLHEHGCPWYLHSVYTNAVEGGHAEVITHLIGLDLQPEAYTLADMLNAAGACNNLKLAQWLHAQGAEWPEVLEYASRAGMRSWHGEALLWARAEGCMAPTELDFSDDDSEYWGEGDC